MRHPVFGAIDPLPSSNLIARILSRVHWTVPNPRDFRSPVFLAPPPFAAQTNFLLWWWRWRAQSPNTFFLLQHTANLAAMICQAIGLSFSYRLEHIEFGRPRDPEAHGAGEKAAATPPVFVLHAETD